MTDNNCKPYHDEGERWDYPKPWDKSLGVSLIELMVVVGCIGLLATAVLPSWQDHHSKVSLKVATEELYAYLQRLQMIASSSHKTLRVTVQHNTNGWLLISTEATKQTFSGQGLWRPTTSGLEHDISQAQYPTLHLASHYPAHQLVIDGHSGGLSNGYFELTQKGQEKRRTKVITSYGAGRIRMCATGQQFYEFPKCNA